MNQIRASILAVFALTLGAGCQDSDAQLERLSTWKYASKYRASDAEAELTKLLLKGIDRKKVRICYGIDSPTYFEEHVLPLHSAMPGPFCGLSYSENSQNVAAKLRTLGIPESDIFLFDRFEDLQEFAKEDSNMLIAAAWTTDHHLLRMTHISHGVDEDKVFCSDAQISKDSPPENDLSLVFTKFNAATSKFSTDDIREFYKLDPNKKTILVLTTFSDSFLDFRVTPKAIFERGIRDLISLKETYNVIIRPHPLIAKETYDILNQSFIIAPNGKFPSFVPFLEVADLVIGELGASSSVPPYKPETPLIVFRPNISFGSGIDYGSITTKYEELLHSPRTSVFQNEDHFDLTAAVAEAFTKSALSQSRAKARENYFQYWYGCIDGYENYRLAHRLLTERKIQLGDFQATYQELPLFKERKLCSLIER